MGSRILASLTLLVLVAAALAVLYPVYPCLDCAIRKANPLTKAEDLQNCGYCWGKGRATVLDHWKGKRDPDLLQPANIRLAPK
jgi:hypothetical protein